MDRTASIRETRKHLPHLVDLAEHGETTVITRHGKVVARLVPPIKEADMSTFRPAQLQEYVDWLQGHLTNGGYITHAYDYPFKNAGFLAAHADFTTDGECGANAVSIIVPDGISHRHGWLGHNELFFMGGFRYEGMRVPVYSDPEFDAIAGVADAREQAEADRKAFESHKRASEYDSDVSDYRRSLRA